MIQGQELPLDAIFAQIKHYLISGWGIVILIGSFASAIFIALGFIYWFTGFEPLKGRRMVVSGIILFVAMQWFAFNPPLLLIIN